MIRPGDIVLVEGGDSLYSKVIRRYNELENKNHPDNKWTHAGVVQRTEGASFYMYESTKNRFELRGPYSTKERVFGFFRTVYPVDLLKLSESFERYSGTPYSWTNIIGIVAFFLFKRQAPKFFDGAKAMFCSEAVCRVLYDATGKKFDVQWETGKPFDLTTPFDLSQLSQVKRIYGK